MKDKLYRLWLTITCIRAPLPYYIRWSIYLLSVLLVIGGYEYLSYKQHKINPLDTTIPSFIQMGEAFVKVCTKDVTGKIWLLEDAKATGSRYAIGLLFGVVVSTVLGVLMGCFRYCESFFLPTLSFFTRIPPTAMLAVFFVLVGTGFEMFVAMIAFGIIPTLTQAIYQAAKYDIHEELIHKGYTLGGSTAEVIIEIIFREILARVMEAIRLQIGPAMVFLIAAEWTMSDVGFGYRLRMQSRLLNLAVVYDYIILLGFYGLGLDYSLTYIRNFLCPHFSKKYKETK